MTEIWKDIEGFEGHYQVSNLGRVKSLEWTYYSGQGHYAKKVQPEKILSQKVSKRTGYCTVLLYGDKRHYCSVHRLVAKAFLPECEGKTIVNHIDGNKQNNNVNNLEWSTYSENTIHAIEHDLRPIRKIIECDLEGKELREWNSVLEAANFYGVTRGVIYNCLHKRIKTVKNRIWKYAVLKLRN